MESTWHLREVLAKDADGLKKCMKSAYTPYLARMDGDRLPPMDADYLSEIANYPSWVAETNGVILGGLIMSFENEKASIVNIAVKPNCQGQGIGSALIRLAESEARKNGYSELHLTTHVLLTENVSLYRHLGWEVTGGNDEKVFMKKSI